MKKTIWTLAMAFIALSASAQSIKPKEEKIEDYLPLLKASGYQAYPFDISEFLNDTYYLTFKVKEYDQGNEIKTRSIITTPNRMMISDFSPSDQEMIIKMGMASDPEKGIFKQMDKVTISFLPVKSDSLQTLLLSLQELGEGTMRLNLKGIKSSNQEELLYRYSSRPFIVDKFEEGKFIPLVLYGSFWFDEKANVIRFCGEKEIDPTMSSDILKYLPHYYVIGVEINKKK